MLELSRIGSLPAGSKVSLTAYVNIDDRPEVETTLPYLKDPIAKKEVAINDNSGIVTLTLWGDKIPLVPQSGTYLLKNLIVKEAFAMSCF